MGFSLEIIANVRVSDVASVGEIFIDNFMKTDSWVLLEYFTA